MAGRLAHAEVCDFECQKAIRGGQCCHMQQAVLVLQVSVDDVVFMTMLDSCNELLEKVDG
jgi:hypothetical protein